MNEFHWDNPGIYLEDERSQWAIELFFKVMKIMFLLSPNKIQALLGFVWVNT